jgi:hypothetical protein
MKQKITPKIFDNLPSEDTEVTTSTISVVTPVNDQPDAQFFPLHVLFSSLHVHLSLRMNCPQCESLLENKSKQYKVGVCHEVWFPISR